MPSPQMLDFISRCPPMPGRIPVEELPATRQALNAQFTELYPALPGVKTQSVVCDGIDAIWYRPQEAERGRVILYIHGGGFMWFSAAAHCGVISRVAAQSRCDTLALDYKVAPYSPYPGPILEAVRLYKWLLESGYSPANIAIAGDSAGGGIALSVMATLKREGVPLPACAAIASAYTDLTNGGESMEWVTTDPCVSLEGLEICLEHYLQGHDPADPLASPLFGDLAGLPPILVQVGSRERLLSDSTRFAVKAEAAGVEVKLEIHQGCVHLWHWLVPDAPEAAAAIKSIGEFTMAHTR